MNQTATHVAGPAGPIEQVCTRCGVVLIDGIPALEGRMFEVGPRGMQRTGPMFFTPGLHVTVSGGGMWLTDDPPDCAETPR